MSTTLSTQTMLAMLARRCPLGYTASVAMDELNNAFRWINQQGSFPWMLRKTTVAVAITSGALTLPGDFDPGKPAVLYGAADHAVPFEIPYMSWEQAVKQQIHGTSGAKVYSCWTYFATLVGTTVTFSGLVFPAAAATANESLPFVYHAVQFPALTSGAATYFPTPDHFDPFIVELAEAELMRQYRVAGWDVVFKRCTDQLRAMLSAYQTSKIIMTPAPEIIGAVQAVQAKKSA